MSVIQPFGLADMASASQFVAFDHAAQSQAVHYLNRLPRAMQEMKKTRNPHTMLALRADTLLCLAKAYANGNREAFSALAHGLLAQPLSLAPRFSPSRSLLLYDLALAISTRHNAAAKNLARAIFATPVSTQAPPTDALYALYAELLACLFDLQFDHANLVNQRLLLLAQAKLLPEHEASTATIWFNMVASLLARDASGVAQAAQDITANRRAQVNRLLARWAKGEYGELIEFDFWDMKTTALLSITDGFGLWPADIDPAGIVFANWRWTEGRDGWV